jgi:hypothetical protein
VSSGRFDEFLPIVAGTIGFIEAAAERTEHQRLQSIRAVQAATKLNDMHGNLYAQLNRKIMLETPAGALLTPVDPESCRVRPRKILGMLRSHPGF